MLHRTFVLAALGAAAVAWPSAPSVAAAATTCDGLVFDDRDGDGRRTVDEPGLPGVLVAVTDAEGVRSSALTDERGGWSTPVLDSRYPIRLEFRTPDKYQPSRTGAHNGTALQFVPGAGACDGPVGSFAVYEPGAACRARWAVVAGCYTPDGAEGREDEAALQLVAPLAVDDGTVSGDEQSDWLTPDPDTIATVGEVGTVYGVAADVRHTVYAASFVKRHSALRSELNPTGNPTTIYRIAAGRSAEVLVTVDPDAVDPHIGPGESNDEHDLEVFDDVFGSGLGDLDVSPDGRHLYAVDLGRRELVTVALPGGEVVARLPLTGPLLGVTDCAVTTDDPFGDLRPFGLGRGPAGQLLLGVVCSAESTVTDDDIIDEDESPQRVLGDPQSLMGYVFEIGDGRAAMRLSWPLANDRGDTRDNGKVSNDATWHPWVDGVPFTDEHDVVSYPQPAITDLALDADGNLIIALGDRWGHQTVARSTAPRTDGESYEIDESVQAGDLQRACPTDDGWSIEGSGCAGGWGNGFEFFDGDSYGWHAETALGSVLTLDDGITLVASQMDPVPGTDPWWSGGIARHDAVSGDYVSGSRLYDGSGADRDASFEHASGVTDLALLCDWTPAEIGGRLWHDVDADGSQDPDEPPIPDVLVELREHDGDVVATTITDRTGGYAFDDGDVDAGLADGDEYLVAVAEANFEDGPFGVDGDFVGLRPTVADADDHDHLDSDGEVASAPAVVAGHTLAPVTVGDDPATDAVESPVDHTVDFGFRDQYDLAVATRWVRDDDTLGVLAFEIVVHNQGSEPSGPFEITNRIPLGTSLIAASRGVVTTRPGSPDLRWSFSADDELGPGETKRLTVMVLVDDESQSPFVNTVRLTGADGHDDDSDPNDTVADEVVDRPSAFREDGTLVDDNGAGTAQDDADIATVYLHQVTGRVWVDVDRDAQFEPDPATSGSTGGREHAGAGVAVLLRHRDGTVIEQQWTNHEGVYRFSMVPSDSYTLEIPADEFHDARPLDGFDWMHSPFRTGAFDPSDGVVIPLTLEALVDAPAHRVDVGIATRPSDPWYTHLRLEWLIPGIVIASAALLLVQRRGNRAAAIAG